ncbi:MAG TPA: hypothetical protein PJ988_11710, partial [Anaerolinea sp.]|nr:hypothetical protein [Anaerolinea sp.]
SCWGAAAWTAMGAGAIESLEAAGALVQIDGEMAPTPNQAAVYDRLYPLFTRLYERLLLSFDEIVEFQEDFPA